MIEQSRAPAGADGDQHQPPRHDGGAGLAELEADAALWRIRAAHAGDTIVQLTAGLIEWVSPSVEELLGYDPVRLVGGQVDDLLHPDDLPLLEDARTRLPRGRTERIRARVRRADGTYRWVDANIRPLLDDAGRFTGTAVTTVLDVQAEVDALAAAARADAERQALEAQARRDERLRALGVLAGGIAHDFNNLLAGVLGNAELALADLPPDAPARPAVERIVTAAERAAELTDRLLGAAGKRAAARPVAVDVAALVGDTVRLVQSTVARTATLDVDVTADLPPVSGDPAQLAQALANLLVNAAESLHGGRGVIRITARRGGAAGADPPRLFDDGAPPTVVVEVHDTGEGIAPDDLGHVFDPFFTTRPDGRGLGLAVVHGVVTSHGGTIEVRSRLGEGTTVTLVLPAASPSAAASPPTAPPAVSPEERRVLVVDDDDLVRDLSAQVLARAGFSPVPCASGEQALRELATAPGSFAAVLLDLTMPGMSGEDVLVAMRRIDREVPVVVISGYSELDRQPGSPLFDAVAFVPKPFTMQELTSAVTLAATAPRRRVD